MKYTSAILLTVLMMAGCGQRVADSEGLITIDVMNSPSPKKELIFQDFMDVEYVPLETNEEFINQGVVRAVSKKEVYMNWLRPLNHEIVAWDLIQAHQLVDSYEKGELKGKLKDIAATLDEESNPVIMLGKHKK